MCLKSSALDASPVSSFVPSFDEIMDIVALFFCHGIPTHAQNIVCGLERKRVVLAELFPLIAHVLFCIIHVREYNGICWVSSGEPTTLGDTFTGTTVDGFGLVPATDATD